MYGARSENIVPYSARLKKESPLMGFVYKVLNSELLKISNEIDKAHRTGKDNTIVKLTFNFNCPQYIENKDVQLNVYYKIIEDLESKGYTISLDINKKEAILYINWKITIDNEKINKMEEKIRSVINKKKL